MSGGGVDWNEELKSANTALRRAEKMCEGANSDYKDAQKKLEDYMIKSQNETSRRFEMLQTAVATARTAYESALKQLGKTQEGANEARALAGQAQAQQGNVDKEEIEMMKKLVTELKGQREPETQCATLSRECNVTHVPYIYPRKCYKKGLKHILRHWGCKIFRFGGTCGIGKTTFRYWVLWRWVHGETQGLQQKHCLFSIGTDRLVLLTRGDDGKIAVKDGGLPCRVYAKRHSWSDDCVGVVEMSMPGTGIYHIPEQQCPCVSFLIVVGSPGKFYKGVPCFKQLAPVAPYYFPAWDADEAVNLPFNHFNPDKDEPVNEAVIRKRCDKYGGVLRLMQSTSIGAECQLKDAFNGLSVATIKAVVVGDSVRDDQNTVHRLLLLKKNGDVLRFINATVARKAMKRLELHTDSAITEFMKIIASNPKAQAFWGHYFEQQFGHGFGAKRMKLKYKEKVNDVSELEGPSNGSAHYTRKQQTLKKKVLYQPPASFQGIDFFMRANKTIYYLQTTVSSAHTAVDLTHSDHTGLDTLLKKCCKSGRSYRRIKRQIIYVVPDEPSADKFTAPEIPDGWVCIVAWPEPGVSVRSDKLRMQDDDSETMTQDDDSETVMQDDASATIPAAKKRRRS